MFTMPTIAKPRTTRSEGGTGRHAEAWGVALLSANLLSGYPELVALGAREGWEVFAQLGAIRVSLGPKERLGGIAELVQFLRGILDPDRLKALRGGWVARDQRLEDQMAGLVHAGALLSLCPTNSPPLLEILRERRLETWYQPVVRAADGRVWGYECLARGRSGAGELIMPDRLIAWSRQENLTSLFDRVCREVHLRNAAEHLAGRDIHLLLNFLPSAVYDAEFGMGGTMSATRAGGFTPSQIVFEVVETEQIKDVDHLRSILDYYRRKGFRVALDDLGCGYSSLAMLGDLNPDLMKIDRQLVAKAPGSPMHRSICASLVRLGREHNKLVLAEGIETLAQRDLLGEMGVDLFQGYLFGRPSPFPANPLVP